MKEKLTANILFSGIGCQEQGIKDTGLFDLDVVSTSDIDKDAILSYAAVHYGMTNEMVDSYNDYPPGEQMAKELLEMNIGYDVKKDKPYDWMKLTRKKANDIKKYWLACRLSNQKGDISKIESLPYADLWTISFPCTNISVAGKMKGLKPNSGTASSLLWENIRLLKDSINRNESPKYLMFENVKNLVSKKFIGDFNDLLDVINELGFNTYWKVLNGKECGVPQNRERVFCIGVRKDIDTGKFKFPKPFDSGIRLKNILEKEVDKKYYLTNKAINYMSKERNGRPRWEYHKNDYNGNACTLTANMYKGVPYGVITNSKDTNCCIQAGDLQYYSYEEMNRIYSKEGLCPTLRTMTGGNRQPKILENTESKIRRLTPCECWKLMGWVKEYFNKAKNIGISDSSLYKQAGNGIITNCVELIFEHLYKAQYNENFKCTDENFTQPQVESIT